ncbi:GbsR/MarR family transcriptional regulator [Brevibacillus humidisoli]|uniref:choline uptake/conversion transcriptional regulator CudC n=1 Tax=Brevibacillus humidisoli TaxID=2895522 RepID=UPI001E5CF02C|nr:GbsR/MarR family transcriptional regulator [Brevibacillus humidisoli]UFJ39160.1 GbsR/MarR family transcriptional regulator [Brevibacillus humidisoli]
MEEPEKKHENILAEAEELVIDAISETMDLYGVTPSIGRLYGVMYFTDEPLTLDQMSSKMGMSKPSMSTSIRALQQIDMVHKVWQKGVRKDLYSAEKDFFKSFISFFCKKWNREIEVNMEAIKKAEEKLKMILDDPSAPVGIYKKAKADMELLDWSKKYYQWLEKLIASFENKEIFRLLEENPPN